MFIRFDEDSQRVLILARKEMLDLKHPYVGTEHLLLAILHCCDLNITMMLNKYNITYDSFKSEIIKVIGFGKKESSWFLYTPLLKKIIEYTISESQNKGSTVTVDELFINLLNEGEGIANRLLIGMNIDIDLLYNNYIKICKKSKTGYKKMLIDDFAVDFNRECLNNKFDPVIGRDEKINRLIEILLRKNKNNPLIVGEAGVGKTALVEELSRRIVEGKVPKKLKNIRILALSLSSLVSGTKYRGEFEERINKMISEVVDDENIILFIDEFHTIVGLGGAEGAIDASNILKPYLARGKLRIIGATTLSEYSKYIEKDKALDRRFQKVFVSEPNIKETEKILLSIKEIYENYHGVNIKNDLILKIVELSSRFISNARHPDKDIDILDEACSKASLVESKYDRRIQTLSIKLSDLKIEKNNYIINNQFNKANLIRNKEMNIENKLVELKNSTSLDNVKEVTVDNIYDVLYEKTKIPVKNIIESEKKDLSCLLKKQIIGQDRAIDEIVDVISKRDYIQKNVPKTLLLVGKTGVGKTMFVKEYAKLFFSEIELLRLDMSEYCDAQSTSKILGAPPGYVGYNENNSFLYRVKNNPYSVILLDEIEKAHNSVLKLFLQVFDEGFLTDSYGEKIDFSNTTIFLTSNFGMNRVNIGYRDNNRLKKMEINNYFGVELVNRLDGIVYFKDLTESSIEKIIKCSMKKYFKNYNLSKEELDKIKDECDYINYGARKIDGIIEKNIDNYIKIAS